MNWVRHGSSTTWFQTSRYRRAKVEFNSINWVRQGSSTTFETGLQKGLDNSANKKHVVGFAFPNIFLQEIWGTFCFRLWNKMPNYFNGNEAFTLAVFNTLWTFQQFADASVYNLQFEFELDQTFRKLTHGLKYSRSSLYTLLLPKTLFA